ncbi:MAG: T9SS type A sorting domain-containing protein [Bacteroidetes bacterium]|nr:T9SS type A sorting domain-containing protein [Bacteroidota bacterium]
MKISFYTALFIVFGFVSNNIFAQCNTPTLSILNTTGDSVYLSWTSVSSAVNYEYAVLPAASSPSSGTITTALTANVGGLTAGTPYKAWVRSNCGGLGYSAWGSLSFSTPCGIPATINISNVAADSAVITWTSVSPGATYQYFVDTVNTTPTGAGTVVATNSAIVKGLLAAKTYYVFVRTVCGSAFSAWSASQSFYSAFPTGINTFTSNEVMLYPNPVKDKLYLQNLQGNTAITITNTLGVIQYRTTTSDKQQTIDFSALTPGLYLLHISNKEGSKTTKVQKQ